MVECDDTRIARASGMNTWRAGCGGSRTSGSEGGPEKRTGGNSSTALRSDPYTQQRRWDGWLYLAVVLDAFSRRIVGWSMTDHLRTDLVLDALNMAVAHRRPSPGMVHHSDHGCQYTSLAFGRRRRETGLVGSMGTIGDCFDNAVAESFFATLECELLDRASWPTREPSPPHPRLPQSSRPRSITPTAGGLANPSTALL